MAFIKIIKLANNSIPSEIDSSNDSIAVKSLKLGGISGTEISKTELDSLIGGAVDASSLHNHSSTYFAKVEFINATTGAGDAGKPIKTATSGKLDGSFILQTDIDHGSISGLNDDDHLQYHNDTRGDARYFQKTEFINSSTGAPDAGKPIKTNVSGKVDGSFIDLSGLSHNTLGSLQGGTASEYYHITSAQHTTLVGGSSDASSLHNHNTQYYTKSQVDASLGAKIDSADAIHKDGSVAFTADQSMGGNQLTNVGAPAASTDAARKQEVDDLSAAVVHKDGSTAMTGNLNMNNNKITNLATPTVSTDAATKGYVDNAMNGQMWRDPVRTLNTTSTSLPTGASYIYDGVTHANGDRVLFIALTNPSENHRVYVLSGVGSSIVFTLETDGQAGTGAPTDGDALYVQEGTASGDTQWNYNGTAFVQFSGAGQIQAGVGLTKTGNVLDVNLGAGIIELPSDEVGIDVHASGGLMTTVDNSTPSTATNSQLAVKLDGSSLTKSASGVKVADNGIANSMLQTDSVSTAKVQNNAITDTKLSSDVSNDANRAVGSDHIKTSAITTAKIAADAVDKTKIAADVAGNGLSQAVGGELDVNVDGSTLEINADALRVKDSGITSAKVAADAINDTHIDWGTGANQVNSADMPIVDSANNFLSSANVEAALQEIVQGTLYKRYTTGENVAVGDLLVMRRDGSSNPRVYKASSLAANNQVLASLVQGDLTFTSVIYSGNSTRIRFVDPGTPSASLSISVTGSDITVNLATDGGSAITSTATEIKSALDGNGSASALISTTISGTAGNVQSAFAYTNLSGGRDYNDNGAHRVIGMALEAITSGNSVLVQKSGELACGFVSAPSASDIGRSVYLSTNSGKATLVPPTGSGDGIVYLGDLVSASAIEFYGSQLRAILS